jgi:molecular chaperone Hsp33
LETIIHKLLSKDKQARIYLIDNTALINELEDNSFLSPVASQVFYTVITFCCLLHGIMTNAKRVSIKLETADPSAFLVCGADASGSIQGYASDDFCQGEYTDLVSMIGSGGCLKIIQDNGIGTIFTGIVEIRNNDISESLDHYFMQSEQTKTIFRYLDEVADSKILLSRGVLIQALPFAETDLMAEWENLIESSKNILSDPNKSVEDLSQTVFSEAEVVERFPVRLLCTCSKEMILDMLLGLGVNELEWTLKDNQDIEVRCNKCGKRYMFGADEIRSLL